MKEEKAERTRKAAAKVQNQTQSAPGLVTATATAATAPKCELPWAHYAQCRCSLGPVVTQIANYTEALVTSTTSAPSPAQTTIPRNMSTTSASLASPHTPRKTSERDYDSQYYPQNPFIYRPGELVWFHKQTGQTNGAWGLGVIAMRSLVNASPRYLLQPLSNPIRHSRPVIQGQEHLRPWLAWSLPPVTHTRISGLAYDQVPWEQVISGALGPGDSEVDGSILKAKVIDSSYSLYEASKKPVPAGEVHYGGMFLGAEKIWIEEPVRLRVPNSNEIVVMIVKKIILRETVMADTSISSNVTLVGDVYKFVEMPNPYANRNDWPTLDLPVRMVTDLRFRNEVAANAGKSVFCEWRLLEPAARRGIEHVKGRWYETRALLPVLRGVNQFREDIQRGVTSDAGLWMNGRGDNGDPGGKRMPNRRGTLGLAVPDAFKVSRGLDGKVEDDVFPSVEDLATLWSTTQPK